MQISQGLHWVLPRGDNRVLSPREKPGSSPRPTGPNNFMFMWPLSCLSHGSAKPTGHMRERDTILSLDLLVFCWSSLPPPPIPFFSLFFARSRARALLGVLENEKMPALRRPQKRILLNALEIFGKTSSRMTMLGHGACFSCQTCLQAPLSLCSSHVNCPPSKSTPTLSPPFPTISSPQSFSS